MLKYGSTIEQLGPCGIQVEILSWVKQKIRLQKPMLGPLCVSCSSEGDSVSTICHQNLVSNTLIRIKLPL